MSAALRTSPWNYGDELKRQAHMVADASVDAGDQISKVVSVLSSRLEDIGDASSKIVDKIGTSRDALAKSETSGYSGSSAVRAADEAATSFGRQSNALFKAVQDATYNAEKIRKEEGRIQRDAFLTSAKFIIESMHSLSVDLTRMMDGEVPEKHGVRSRKATWVRLPAVWPSWARKCRSNVCALNSPTTRVIPVPTSSASSASSRNCSTKRSPTIMATCWRQPFASSDIGALYMTLCQAAGREAKLSRESRFAA